MSIPFKTSLGLVLSAAALSIAASPMSAEDDARKVATPEYCTLSSLLGAKVSMLPGAQAKHEANKEQEVAARPIGKVTDILLESDTGHSRWAVVSFDTTLGFGGKSVAIPCDQLRWNAPEDRFDLSQTEDHLKQLPAFDADDAKKQGFELSVASLSKHWPDSKFHAKDGKKNSDRDNDNDRDDNDRDDNNNADAGNKNNEPRQNQQRPSITIDGKRFDCSKPQLVLATDIMDNVVYANSEKFGAVTGGLIDHDTHAIDFLIVSRGGTLGVGAAEYLIPFYAMCTHGGNDGTEMVYSCLHSTKELEAGVRYLKPENGAVDSEAVRRAHELFAKDAPKQRSSSN